MLSLEAKISFYDDARVAAGKILVTVANSLNMRLEKLECFVRIFGL